MKTMIPTWAMSCSRLFLRFSINKEIFHVAEEEEEEEDLLLHVLIS